MARKRVFEICAASSAARCASAAWRATSAAPARAATTSATAMSSSVTSPSRSSTSAARGSPPEKTGASSIARPSPEACTRGRRWRRARAHASGGTEGALRVPSAARGRSAPASEVKTDSVPARPPDWHAASSAPRSASGDGAPTTAPAWAEAARTRAARPEPSRVRGAFPSESDVVAVSDAAGTEAIGEGAGRRMLRQGERLREPETPPKRGALSGSSAAPAAAPRPASASPPPCAETGHGVRPPEARDAPFSLRRASARGLLRADTNHGGGAPPAPARGGQAPAIAWPLAPRRARQRAPSRRGRGAAPLR